MNLRLSHSAKDSTRVHGELFHRIFLSGDAVNLHLMVPLVVVAHSMGGLVVRRALAELEEPPATDVIWISLATPFGGHPSARGVGESSMLILPSWRDLDPESTFLAALYRRPLPAQVTHHLLYAYRDESLVRFGENSDGVVPLSSQLQPSAQRQATRQLGVDATHVGILHATAALDAIGEILASVQTRIPREHMAVLRRGGFAVDEGDYSPLERYGHFLRALADGELAPLDEQHAQLVAGIRGQAESTDPSVTAWRKFAGHR